MTKVLNLKLVILSEYKNIKYFLKGYTPNQSEEVFVINKFKSTVSSTYIISDLKREETVGTFYKKELQKQDQKNLELKK